MDVFPKFIIEADDELGDLLIIGKCTYHKQLASDISKIKGGGWWRMDKDKGEMVLNGDSHDFGRAKVEDIWNCIKNKKVFTSLTLTNNISEKFNFKYLNEVGETIDLPIN